MIKLFILVLGISNVMAFSLRGDGVGNGGGIAENNIVFAYQNLASYIDYATFEKNNDFDSQEINLLTLIRANLPNEYRNKRQLVFLSGRRHPNIFIYPFNQVRLAVTGSKVGSVIYINTDLLYTKDQNGIKALSITQAVSMLIHEMGHHHNVHDELVLNTLGAKVAKISAMDIEKRTLRGTQVYFKFINFGKNGFANLIIGDQVNSVDLTKDLKAQLRCPNHYGDEVVGVEVWQAGWTKRNHHSWYSVLELITYCKNENRVNAYSGNEYLIFPSYHFNQGRIELNGANTQIRQCNPTTSNCMAKQQEVETYIENKL